MGFLNMGSKEPSEMDRVTENIARIEGELQQKIFQLGQMYYTEHKDDEETENKYYQMIDQITKLDQNRKGFYRTKLRLQGQMMCENCGAIIPYGSIYCNACGKKADEKQETSPNAGSLKCANCGASLNEGSMFCTACGAKVE